MSFENAKEEAAKKAAEFIQSGFVVGLGTGSTASFFIKALIERVKKGLRIRTVPSSRHSADLAQKGGIEVLNINDVSHIDITVDGADEVDPKKRMIKGKGGAHVREKILASASREMVVIIDESKLVKQLGSKEKLPVELLFYGAPSTRQKIETLGFQGKWRMSDDGTLFISENGNLIFDIAFEMPPQNIEAVHEKLKHIPGVIDTGLCIGLAGRVVIGHADGSVKIWN
ncbi:MAG: ribose-5-phosphate isomerase RpiA [Chlamydiae bacterium]|nr:ribose-5-phosphate isomerase RpiA [Chlamydiota bacterium]